MGLIEYVPALITFDYLVVAIDNSVAADVARYIHAHNKNKCGLLIAFNTEYNILLQTAKNQHRRIIILYQIECGTYSMDRLRSLFAGDQKEIEIPVSSIADGASIAFLIGNRTP
jgi:hypothetical protein